MSVLYLGKHKHRNAKIVPFKCSVNGFPELSHLLHDFFNTADLQVATHIDDAVWLYKSCNVIIWVRLWAAGTIAVKEMMFCIATANWVARTMRTDALCCWKKK